MASDLEPGWKCDESHCVRERGREKGGILRSVETRYDTGRPTIEESSKKRYPNPKHGERGEKKEREVGQDGLIKVRDGVWLLRQ